MRRALPVDAVAVENTGPNGRVPVSLVVFAVAAGALALLLVAAHTVLGRGHALQWAPWAYSEWLISYRAGFVRRGLAGTLIRLIAGDGDLLQTTNRVVFLSYAGFVASFITLILWRERNAVRGAIAMLVPGSIMQMALTNEMYYRKEIIFHLFLALVGIGVILTKNGNRSLVFGLTIGAASLVFPFITEIFFFTTLPALMVLLYLRLAPQYLRQFWRLAMWLGGLHLAVFILLSFFKGTREVANALWLSLPLPDRLMVDPNAPETPAGGIAGIGFSLAAGLKDPLWAVVTGFSWYWMLAGGAIFYLLRRLYRDEDGPRLLLLGRALTPTAMIFLGTLPLFFLGWDWGRWLSCATVSSLIVAYVRGPADMPNTGFLPAGRRGEIFALAALFGVSFLVRMPECCITASSEPAYVNIRDLIRQWR